MNKIITDVTKYYKIIDNDNFSNQYPGITTLLYCFV